MYKNQTFEVIVQRMLQEISDDIDKREGSVAYDMLAPKANELAISYLELNNIINFGFAETSYGEYLDRKVIEAGIVRLSAVKSEGEITFVSETENLAIPAGSIVYTDEGIRFLTKEDTKIINGSATVDIIAEVGGNSGNVPANSIINNEISEVTCYNLVSTSGGSDTESDESLTQRYLRKVRNPSSSGNVYHYQDWAESVDGIGDSKVFPIWNGGGTVKVVVIGDDLKPVTTQKVAEVSAYIETQRPIGANVTVESGTAKTINISSNLTLKEGTALEEVRPILEAEFTKYFKEVAFNELDVKYTRIGNIILGVDAILDYTNLKVNNGTTNVVLTEFEVPVLGTVGLAV
jgi:uncharacterized phage protein gp47/JayE